MSLLTQTQQRHEQQPTHTRALTRDDIGAKMKGEGFPRLTTRCDATLKRFTAHSETEINTGYANRFKGISRNKEITRVTALVVPGATLPLISTLRLWW